MRRILWLGMWTTLGGSLLIATDPALPVALASNLVVGLGAGAIASSSAGYLVYSADPQRNLAALTVAQNLYATLLLQAVIPRFAEGSQASSLFVLMGLVMLAVIPAIRQFAPGEAIPPAYHDGPVRPWGVFLILFSVFLSFVSGGVVWTFMAERAHSAGIGEGFVSDVLTGCNLLSLLLCLGVKWMGGRHLHRWGMLTLGLSTLGVAVLTLPVTPWRLAAGSAIFVGFWTLSSVLVPTLLPAYDPVGRRTALTPAAFGLGFSLGSSLGGLIGEHVGMDAAFATATVLSALSLGALLALRQWAWHEPQPAVLVAPLGNS
jgi:predicted MFS family arabinose efflux permease